MTDMSKHSKKKARKRRHRRETFEYHFVCPTCQRVDDGSPASLLTGIADALNAAIDSGMDLKVKSGWLIGESPTGGGYVLQIRADGRWTARNSTYDRFQQVVPVPDDED